ncbi:WXG100 family type VII secretion target [Oryzobacter terrae]|uniref:WXG100 family type VII secretion target n=1 Tax=Oryzobacter terrae TaxID=1620385 RepID=UPI00366D36CC
MTLVPGDPASLSACARTVAEVAGRLRTEAGGLEHATTALGEGWTGRTSATTRRSAAELAGATASLADELEGVARALQDQATDLADLVARERGVRERATVAGLEVRDGRVELAWGVSGTADAGRRDEQEAARAALQSDLDLVAAQHARRRDFVLGLLRASSATLAEVSHALRLG